MKSFARKVVLCMDPIFESTQMLPPVRLLDITSSPLSTKHLWSILIIAANVANVSSVTYKIREWIYCCKNLTVRTSCSSDWRKFGFQVDLKSGVHLFSWIPHRGTPPVLAIVPCWTHHNLHWKLMILHQWFFSGRSVDNISIFILRLVESTRVFPSEFDSNHYLLDWWTISCLWHFGAGVSRHDSVNGQLSYEV